MRDVVVVGGGPAGLSLLASLQADPATSGLSVALVDSQPIVEKLTGWADAQSEEHYANRASSLTPHTLEHLRQIGAFAHLREDRIGYFDEMVVWDGESNATIEFDAFGTEDHKIAAMCENENLQQALLRTLRDPEIFHSGVDSIERPTETDWPIVHLSNGTTLQARLLVGADGQASPVRRFAKIESRGWDYGRHGVVASLDHDYEPFRRCAYQRFLRTGPIALLPFPETKVSLVWTTLPERAQWLKALEPEAFVAMVNAGFKLEQADLDYLHTLEPTNTKAILDEIDWRLGVLDEDRKDFGPEPVVSVEAKSIASFPLRMRHADSYVADRIALIGDAAHATHPLTGQGLNAGQRDVEALVEAIKLARDRGLDIGSTLALQPYPRAQYLRNHALLGVNDKLHKLYSTDFWPIVQLRSLGLEAVNSLGWLKSALMERTGN